MTASNRNETLHRWGWIALLTGATALGSFVFACATPLAALGALAALHLNRREAFALVGLNWLVNQVVGYGFLSYPVTADSISWGAIMLVAALAATAAAMATEQAMKTVNWSVTAIAAFLAAFVTYELVQVAATVVAPTDMSVFGVSVITYVLEVNGIAFAALLVLQGAGRALGFALPRATGAVAAA